MATDKKVDKKTGVRTERITRGPASDPMATRPVRDKPDERAAVDTPFEIPVYLYYLRHVKPGEDPDTHYALNQLLGWTLKVNAFTYGADIQVKIFRDPDKIALEVNGKQVWRSTKKTKIRPAPPFTVPEEDDTTEGWATKAGRDHAAVKRTDQRREGTSDKEPEDEWEDF